MSEFSGGILVINEIFGCKDAIEESTRSENNCGIILELIIGFVISAAV